MHVVRLQGSRCLAGGVALDGSHAHGRQRRHRSTPDHPANLGEQHHLLQARAAPTPWSAGPNVGPTQRAPTSQPSATAPDSHAEGPMVGPKPAVDVVAAPSSTLHPAKAKGRLGSRAGAVQGAAAAGVVFPGPPGGGSFTDRLRSSSTLARRSSTARMARVRAGSAARSCPGVDAPDQRLAAEMVHHPDVGDGLRTDA